MATDTSRAELKNVRDMQFVILITSLFMVITQILQFLLLHMPCKFSKDNKYMTIANRLFQQNNVQFVMLLFMIFLFILIVCSYDRMNAFLSN